MRRMKISFRMRKVYLERITARLPRGPQELRFMMQTITMQNCLERSRRLHLFYGSIELVYLSKGFQSVRVCITKDSQRAADSFYVVRVG